MRYLSVAEIAKKWNISERSVRNYCAHGRVQGAFLTGKTWNIPEKCRKNQSVPTKRNGWSNGSACRLCDRCMACGPYFFACDTPSKRCRNLRILKEIILQIGGALCRKLTEVQN